MNEDNTAFYRRRLDQERELEVRAASPEAASAHRLLAKIYAQHLEELDGIQSRPALFASNAGEQRKERPSRQKPARSSG